jgi:hypothetical protein
MRIRLALIVGALMVPAVAGADDLPVARLRTAAQKALFLLEKVSPTFIEKGGCNSCHNQSLPVAAQAFARRRGVPTGEPIAQLANEGAETATEQFIEYAAPGGSGVSGLGYKLFARAVASHPADERVHAQIHYLESEQDADGSWRATSNRPPLTFDRFTSTALAIHALNAFALPADVRDTAQRVDRARAWLMKSTPESTQERAFQLLGLVWSKADAAALRTAVTALQATQGKDGAWSQLPSMPADAYATALSLYALYEGGVPVTSAPYQAGLRFLLETQAADGTWHVKARSLPIQPYFESGYPYGHDQWISSAAAAYAAMAFAAAIPQEQTAEKQ